MLKNLRKTLVLITLVAVLTLFSVGYAAWTFSGGAETTFGATVIGVSGEEGGGPGGATDVELEGTVEVTSGTIYLIIDQSFVGFATTATATSADYTVATLKYTGSNAEDLDEEFTVQFSADVDVPDSLATYLEFNVPTNPFVGGTSVYETTFSGEAVTANYTLPTVTWKTGMKPTNKAEYDAMVEAIGTNTISFTFRTVVVED